MFRRSHPGVRLELREATTAGQLAALRAGELDVAIAIPPFGEVGGLRAEVFDRDWLAIALPIAHRLSDLADEAFVLWLAREGRGF